MNRARKMICLAAVAVMILTAGAAAAKPETHSRGDAKLPRIAITIDDWWNPGMLPEFLTLAAEHGCHLTLYPVGTTLHREDRDSWRRAVDEGHEIGNHSSTHLRLGNANYNTIYKQLTQMESALNACLGYEYTINTCRLPYGDDGDSYGGGELGRAVEDAGYVHIIYWMISANDAPTILKQVRNGHVILLHANQHDLNTLRKILPELAARGYEMVTVSELFGLTKTGYMGDETETK